MGGEEGDYSLDVTVLLPSRFTSTREGTSSPTWGLAVFRAERSRSVDLGDLVKRGRLLPNCLLVHQATLQQLVKREKASHFAFWMILVGYPSFFRFAKDFMCLSFFSSQLYHWHPRWTMSFLVDAFRISEVSSRSAPFFLGESDYSKTWDITSYQYIFLQQMILIVLSDLDLTLRKLRGSTVALIVNRRLLVWCDGGRCSCISTNCTLL